MHQNYLIEDKTKIISFLSVVVTDANEMHIPQYKIILWTRNVCFFFSKFYGLTHLKLLS